MIFVQKSSMISKTIQTKAVCKFQKIVFKSLGLKTAWIPAYAGMTMETTKVVQVKYSSFLHLIILAQAGIQAVFLL